MSSPPYQRPDHQVTRHGGRIDPVGQPRDGDHAESVAPDIRRSGLRARMVVIGLLAIAAVVTGLLGGFDRVVPPPAPAQVGPGTEIDAGPYLVTVESAEIGHELRRFNTDIDGDLTLQINVRIEVVDTSTTYIAEAVSPDDFPGLTDDISLVRSLADNSLKLQAQPGLPVRVAYLWGVAQGTKIPSTVTLKITGQERRYQSFRFLGTTIEYPVVKAFVTVPVHNRVSAT